MDGVESEDRERRDPEKMRRERKGKVSSRKKEGQETRFHREERRSHLLIS